MIENCLEAIESGDLKKLVRKYYLETREKCLFEVMLDKL